METRGIGRFAKLMIDLVPRGQSGALQGLQTSRALVKEYQAPILGGVRSIRYKKRNMADNCHCEGVRPKQSHGAMEQALEIASLRSQGQSTRGS